MAALHEALRSLAPIEYSAVPIDDLKSYLTEAFRHAQVIVDSVPLPPPNGDTASTRSRSDTSASIASNASEISLSSARSDPPPAEILGLQKEWGKPVKLSAKDNPLGISVYKASGKDGNGAWFARRSVHEGLGFTKWKKSLQNEFPETLKVQGNPGEGNIRGIGGERIVEKQEIENVGKLEVYHLNAQFPGPTAPRDFVEMILTSDSALTAEGSKSDTSNGEIPRHYMVISKPCIHPECPPRDGFVRGQYESVEFIREIPLEKPPKRSASAVNLSSGHSRGRSSSSSLHKEAIVRNAQKVPVDTAVDGSRQRGKTISFAESRGNSAKGETFDVPREDDPSESNPVEWIMISRSDPGGGIPRFMVERGTPGSIVADASKFLDWACSNNLEDMMGTDKAPETQPVEAPQANSERQDTKDIQPAHPTNGHVSGTKDTTPAPPEPSSEQSGIYATVAGAVGMAGGMIAAHTPEIITNHMPGYSSPEAEETPRRPSLVSAKSSNTVDSFFSAQEGTEYEASEVISEASGASKGNPGVSSIYGDDNPHDKELQKLEERKRKLDQKLAKTKEKELAKKTDDTDKESAALAKAEEKHQKEVAKQEEKYRKEVAKLEAKRKRELQKADEKRRKLEEKDEKVRLTRESEEAKAQAEVLQVEKEILKRQVGSLQAQNTALAVRVGQLGKRGEDILREVREETLSTTERARASSILSSRTSLDAKSAAGS